MITKYSDFQMVALNYAKSFETIGEAAGYNFLRIILEVVREAAENQKIAVEDMWSIQVTLPEPLLKLKMENRKMYVLLDAMLDIFSEDSKIRLIFEGETLPLVGVEIGPGIR